MPGSRGKLKEITWAKETLLDHLRVHGCPPGPGTNQDANEGNHQAAEKFSSDAIPSLRGRPWWWSSAVVIALAIFFSGLYYAYRPAPHKPAQSRVRLVGREPFAGRPDCSVAECRAAAC